MRSPATVLSFTALAFLALTVSPVSVSAASASGRSRRVHARQIESEISDADIALAEANSDSNDALYISNDFAEVAEAQSPSSIISSITDRVRREIADIKQAMYELGELGIVLLVAGAEAIINRAEAREQQRQADEEKRNRADADEAEYSEATATPSRTPAKPRSPSQSRWAAAAAAASRSPAASSPAVARVQRELADIQNSIDQLPAAGLKLVVADVKSIIKQAQSVKLGQPNAKANQAQANEAEYSEEGPASGDDSNEAELAEADEAEAAVSRPRKQNLSVSFHNGRAGRSGSASRSGSSSPSTSPTVLQRVVQDLSEIQDLIAKFPRANLPALKAEVQKMLNRAKAAKQGKRNQAQANEAEYSAEDQDADADADADPSPSGWPSGSIADRVQAKLQDIKDAINILPEIGLGLLVAGAESIINKADTYQFEHPNDKNNQAQADEAEYSEDLEAIQDSLNAAWIYEDAADEIAAPAAAQPEAPKSRRSKSKSSTKRAPKKATKLTKKLRKRATKAN